MVCQAGIAGLGHEPRDSRKPSASICGRRRVTGSSSTVCQDDSGLLGCLGLCDLCHLAIPSQDILRPPEIAPLAVDRLSAVRSVAAEQGRQITRPIDSKARGRSRLCSRPSGGGLMCTLTVVTGDDAYLMAMNRDEKIARGAGLPPEFHEFDGTRAIYPSDGDGGTWLATNEYGIALALLNWNDIALHRRAFVTTRSRGRVIPALIDSRSLSDLHEVFGASNFTGMMPFRLVGVFPSEQEIWEWRWDSTQLEVLVHAWESRHWFSSRLSDERAERLRGAACRTARHESDACSVPWLRRLQASHAGGPGPFSLCVHRGDVRTLSYTEVMVKSGSVRMCHFLGSPCTMNPADPTEIEIERKRPAHPNLIVQEVGCSAV